MKETPIEWCDSSVNPVMGCDGCELWLPTKPDGKRCYAGVLTERYAGHTKGYPASFEEPTMFPGRMAKAAAWSDLRGKDRPDKPWLNGLPRMIFISDMGDALSRDVPFEYLRDEIINNVASKNGQRHIWLWLTKQPGRMAEFSRWLAAQDVAWPENLWAITSITSRATLGRVRQLAEVVGPKVRGLSVEPLIEDVDLTAVCYTDGDAEVRVNALTGEAWVDNSDSASAYTNEADGNPRIDWVIIGGESGRDPPPRAFDLNWGRTTIRDCRAAGVRVFFKQAGANAHDGGEPVQIRSKKGGHLDELPPDLHVREFPEAAHRYAA